MNKNRVTFGEVLFGLVACALVIYLSLVFKPKEKTIHEYYQVYLGGEKIGLIKSENALYELIDQEQQEIKEKYKVDKVYSPQGLEVNKVSTYKDNVMDVKDIYEEIKDLDPFTIEGYEVTIKYEDGTKRKIYLLNKEDLDVAVKNTVLAFVKEDDYNNYLAGTQEKIVEEGIEIAKIYFESEVTIKKTYISVEEDIFTNAKDLSQFFLFGTRELNKTYTVKPVDTIESIAYANELGVSDFLIANPDLGGPNALLAAGQTVNVSSIEPLSNIVVESFQTEYQDIGYDTRIEFDKNIGSEEMYIKSEGSNGKSQVTFAIKEMNGVILDTAQVSSTVIVEPVDRVVVYGSKGVTYYGNTTYWAWPTVRPFKISSYYGYRVHPIRGTAHFHTGVDISGTSSRNIFAVQGGTVKKAVDSGYNSGMGKYIKIDHENGYVSTYMHLATVGVNEGDRVEKGQVIGIMGKTGSATGIHLHYEMHHNGDRINPLSLYQ